MRQKTFVPGVSLESNTVYTGSASEYHIWLDDTVKKSGYGCDASGSELAIALFMDGLENVTIDLNGATLVLHGRIAPVVATHCRNIVLKNFNIDYDRPYYSQGELLAIDANGIKLKWDGKNFPYKVVDGVPYAVSETWEQPLNTRHMLWQPFDPVTRAPAENAGCILSVFGKNEDDKNPPLPITHMELVSVEDDVFDIKGEFPATWQKGMIIAMTHERRDKDSIFVEYCENVTVERVRLIHGASMGFTAIFCQDILLRHFDMYLDERTRGLVSINADGVHAFHCSGKFIIEDCIFENMLDDAVNIHGNYNIVDSCSGNIIKASAPGHDAGTIKWYQAGDILAIHKGRTQEVRNAVTVKDVVYNSDDTMEITAEDVFSAEPGDIIENLAMPELTIRRCISGNNRPRGFLLSSGGKTLVEDCYFHNCSTGIHFTGDTTYWYESGPVKDVTIRHCHFRDCGYCGDSYAIAADPQVEFSEAEPVYHKNILIEDNIFASFSNAAIRMNYCGNVTFRNNTIIHTNTYTDRNDEPVILNNCIDCNITK